MAEVWHGVDRRLGRAVAVKVMRASGRPDSSLPARFDREARTVAGLSHPNIVPVHDVGAHHGVPYLVMELVDGRTLADLLDDGPLPVAEAVRIAIEVCAALEAAAEAGVVHRDLKPANILITGDGRVKVCDFGLARRAGAAHAELTGTAQMIGTCGYMAPEQVTGSSVDARTDLYGLGCVLYTMLTGQPPFVGDSAMEVAWKHVESTAEPVSLRRPDLPVELDRLLRALLAKYPADRPAGPGEVLAVLRGLAGAPPIPAAARSARRWFRPAALGVAAVVAIGCLVALTPPDRPGRSESPPVPRASGPSPAVSQAAPAVTRTGAARIEPTRAGIGRCVTPGRGRPPGNRRGGCPGARR